MKPVHAQWVNKDSFLQSYESKTTVSDKLDMLNVLYNTFPKHDVTKMQLLKQLSIDSNDKVIYKRYLRTKGILETNMRAHSEAIRSFNELLQKRNEPDLMDSAIALNRLIKIYRNFNLEEAYELQKQIKRMQTRVVKIDSNFNFNYIQLSSVYNRLGDYEGAIKMLKKEHEEVILSIENGSLNHTTRLARLYISNNQIDSALHYYLLAEQQLNYKKGKGQKVPNKHYGRINLGRAQAYLAQGDYAQTIKYARQSIQNYSKPWEFIVYRPYIVLAEALIYNNQVQEARHYTKIARQIIEKKDDATGYKDFLRLETKLYAATGEYQKAFMVLQQYTRLIDSLDSIKNSRALLAYTMKFQNDVLEADLEAASELAQKRSQQAQAERKRRNLILYLLGGVLLLTFFVYRSFRVYKKRGQLLSAQNEEIKEQKALIEHNLEEKKILLKEVYHRVKNNLQVVSGLLSLQANQFEDTDFALAMENARQRILSMTLVHQMLVNDDDVQEIKFNSFLEELVKSVQEQFHSLSKKTEIHTDVPVTHIDVSLAVNLGIIINEILTNAFKHAFPEDRTDHRIWIQLAKSSDTYELSIRDNGIGVKDVRTVEKNIGWQLIQGLSKQIGGTLDIESKDGLKYTLTFSNAS